MTRPIIVLGAGGHARVVLDVLRLCNYDVLGITDHSYRDMESYFLGCKMLGDDDIISQYSPDEVLLINAIGTLPIRETLFKRFKNAGYIFASLIHPKSILATDVEIAEGVQIMAGAVVQPGCKIGENTIINTRGLVDHESIIGSHVHIAPGAVLCGKVSIGDRTHVGAGATIIQNIKIGKLCFIAAGAVVVNHIENGTAVKGIPAKV